MRKLLSPLWLVWHAFSVGAIVGMVFLGRWQLHRAYHTHSIQNYGYAGEWWAFALFGLVFWGKTIRDELQPERRAQVAEARSSRGPVERARPLPAVPVAVASIPVPSAEDDPEVAAYNAYLAYLAQLAARPKR